MLISLLLTDTPQPSPIICISRAAQAVAARNGGRDHAGAKSSDSSTA